MQSAAFCCYGLAVRWFRLFFLVVLGFLPCHRSHAHEVQKNCSYTVIDTSETRLQWTITFNLYDLNRFFHLDKDHDRYISFAEIRAELPQISRQLLDNIHLSIDGKPLPVQEYPNLFLDAHRALIMEKAFVKETIVFAGDARYTESDALMSQFNFIFGADITQKPSSISMDVGHFFTLDPDHRHLAIIDFMGEKPVLFDKSSPQQSFTFSPSTGKFEPANAWAQSVHVRFIKFGIEHILIGYDHILFLLGLILVSLRLRELVKIVTAFTVAHSITLTLAAMNWVRLPPRLIESAIALTIIYIAVENFSIKDSKHRWKLTFGFGLVHGFGFANVLQKLDLTTDGFAASLLSFNLGVEIGQLLIVLASAPLFVWCAKSKFYPRGMKVASAIIGLFGVIWFIQRATGWNII